MNQAQLIRATSKKTIYSIWEYNIIFDAFIDTIKSTLESGESVQLNSFGKFEVKAPDNTQVTSAKRKVMFKCAEAFDVNE